MSHVVGIDIGHSAVKISVGEQKFLFPSVVMKAVKVHDELEAHRCEQESVTISGRKFFYGESALSQSVGETTLGLNDTWVETEHHEALVCAAIKELSKRGIILDETSIVVAGLPIKAFGSSKDALATQFKKHTKADVRVVPQPFGPFFATMLDANGYNVPGREVTSDSYAVVDIGYFTTDIIVMRKGRFIQQCSGSAEGAHIAAKHLRSILFEEKGMNPTLNAAEEALRRNVIVYKGRVDVTLEVQRAQEHLCRAHC